MLTMHREARAQIIGQLREVADGKTEKSLGNGLRLEWEGKLGLVAGVTPIIDEQHSFLAIMGERFCLYRMPEVPRADIACRSLARRGHQLELRQRIRATVGDFLEQFRNCGRLELPDSFIEPLIVLTDIVTRVRSGVARDGYTRELLYQPEPEAPTRLAKQLAQLGAAALAIGVDEAEAWRLIRKLGWNSVPAVRCSVIDCLARQDEPIPLATIQEETGLPERTAARVAEDVVAPGSRAGSKTVGAGSSNRPKSRMSIGLRRLCPKRRRGCSVNLCPKRRRALRTDRSSTMRTRSSISPNLRARHRKRDERAHRGGTHPSQKPTLA